MSSANTRQRLGAHVTSEQIQEYKVNWCELNARLKTCYKTKQAVHILPLGLKKPFTTHAEEDDKGGDTVLELILT